MNKEKLNSRLIDAVNRDCKEEVLQLLEQGAELECRDYFGNTPLMCAAWVGSEQLVRLFLSLGANINARDKEGKSALEQALEVGHNKYGHEAVINALKEFSGNG